MHINVSNLGFYKIISKLFNRKEIILSYGKSISPDLSDQLYKTAILLNKFFRKHHSFFETCIIRLE